jgi:hypothetical protein
VSYLSCDSFAMLNGRYTKALDNIRALRKERTAELKVDRERLKFLKSDKDKAERVSSIPPNRSRADL